MLVVAAVLGACTGEASLPADIPPTTAPSPEPTTPLPDPIPSPAVQAMNAGQAFEQGIALSREGQYQQAIQYLTKAIEMDPVHTTAYYVRGNAYIQQKEYEKALIDLNKSTALEITREELDGLQEITDSIVPPGELVLLNLTCSSEGGINCQGNPIPYTNSLHLYLFVNPGESGVEIGPIHISPPMNETAEVSSPIRYLNNRGVQHLVTFVTSPEPPTTPPSCSIDYRPRDDLSYETSNLISAKEIFIEELICPR